MNRIFVEIATIMISILILASGIQVVQTENSTPLLKVEPEEYNTCIGVFSVDVTISNLSAESQLAGAQLTLTYNSSMLELLDVDDGPFLRSYALANWCEYCGMETNYYFVIFPELENITVLIGFHYCPCWFRLYPEGNGTVATFKFRVKNTTAASSKLMLVNTFLWDEVLTNIPHNVQHGYYSFTRIPWDLNLDGYVDISDIVYAADSFGSHPEHPRWYTLADVNTDDYVGIDDLAIIAGRFGTTCPYE